MKPQGSPSKPSKRAAARSSKPRKKRSRTEPLSRETVLGAALKLADERGLDALSMRVLAEALGVEAMSLYNHVANKEAILDGLVEEVVSELEMPSFDVAWRDAMRRRAISAHHVL